MATIDFDADKTEPLGTFEVIPIGEYLATITKTSELKPSKKDPDNKYIQIDFTILDGQYKGRIIFDLLNLVNKSQAAADFAQRKLSSITRAVGLHKIRDTDELKDKPLMIRVGIRKAEPNSGYDDQNVIKEYKTASGAPVTTNSTSSGQAAPPQKMPWEH